MDLTEQFSKTNNNDGYAHFEYSHALPEPNVVDKILDDRSKAAISSEFINMGIKNDARINSPSLAHVVDTNARPSELTIDVSKIVENLPVTSPIAQALISSGLVDFNIRPFQEEWGISAKGNIHADTDIKFVADTKGLLGDREVYRVDTVASAVINTKSLPTANPLSINKEGLFFSGKQKLPGFIHRAEISGIILNSDSISAAKNKFMSENDKLSEVVSDQNEHPSSNSSSDDWLPDLSLNVYAAPTGEVVVGSDMHIKISTTVLVPPEVAEKLNGELNGSIGSADLPYKISVINDGVEGDDVLRTSVDIGELKIETSMKAFHVADVLGQLDTVQDKLDEDYHKLDRLDKINDMLDENDPKLMQMISDAVENKTPVEEVRQEFLAYVDSAPDLPGEPTSLAEIANVKSTFNISSEFEVIPVQVAEPELEPEEIKVAVNEEVTPQTQSASNDSSWW